ncbi:Erg28 like protein-domain-containing protein [Gaertneriomyces semiglobifer]|nr:Erg28 like protein-domain-containing protein [Gaertneriomyces semiglobifer]
MPDLTAFLPEGSLPKMLFVVGAVAFYNGLQCFVPRMRVVSRIYPQKPVEVTALMSRMMGTWTITSGIVRMYCAWNIHNRAVYEIAMWTYVLAFLSFASETFLYKTAKFSSPGVWPAFIISPVSLIWMWTQYDAYVGK